MKKNFYFGMSCIFTLNLIVCFELNANNNESPTNVVENVNIDAEQQGNKNERYISSGKSYAGEITQKPLIAKDSSLKNLKVPNVAICFVKGATTKFITGSLWALAKDIGGNFIKNFFKIDNMTVTTTGMALSNPDFFWSRIIYSAVVSCSEYVGAKFSKTEYFRRCKNALSAIVLEGNRGISENNNSLSHNHINTNINFLNAICEELYKTNVAIHAVGKLIRTFANFYAKCVCYGIKSSEIVKLYKENIGLIFLKKNDDQINALCQVVDFIKDRLSNIFKEIDSENEKIIGNVVNNSESSEKLLLSAGFVETTEENIMNQGALVYIHTAYSNDNDKETTAHNENFIKCKMKEVLKEYNDDENDLKRIFNAIKKANDNFLKDVKEKGLWSAIKGLPKKTYDTIKNRVQKKLQHVDLTSKNFTDSLKEAKYKLVANAILQGSTFIDLKFASVFAFLDPILSLADRDTNIKVDFLQSDFLNQLTDITKYEEKILKLVLSNFDNLLTLENRAIYKDAREYLGYIFHGMLDSVNVPYDSQKYQYISFEKFSDFLDDTEKNFFNKVLFQINAGILLCDSDKKIRQYIKEATKSSWILINAVKNIFDVRKFFLFAKKNRAAIGSVCDRLLKDSSSKEIDYKSRFLVATYLYFLKEYLKCEDIFEKLSSKDSKINTFKDLEDYFVNLKSQDVRRNFIFKMADFLNLMNFLLKAYYSDNFSTSVNGAVLKSIKNSAGFKKSSSKSNKESGDLRRNFNENEDFIFPKMVQGKNISEKMIKNIESHMKDLINNNSELNSKTIDAKGIFKLFVSDINNQIKDLKVFADQIARKAQQ